MSLQIHQRFALLVLWVTILIVCVTVVEKTVATFPAIQRQRSSSSLSSTALYSHAHHVRDPTSSDHNDKGDVERNNDKNSEKEDESLLVEDNGDDNANENDKNDPENTNEQCKTNWPAPPLEIDYGIPYKRNVQ